jgi:hypothetical protein
VIPVPTTSISTLEPLVVAAGTEAVGVADGHDHPGVDALEL